MTTFEPYDVDRALAEARVAMRRTDPVSLAVVALAEGYARKMRAQFADRDLRLVVEVLIVSSASLGVLVDSNLGVAAVNVQAVAAVLIVDALAMAEAEQAAR